MSKEPTGIDIKTMLRERYGARAGTILREGPRCCCDSEMSCCGSTPAGTNAFSAELYAIDELDGVPLQAALATLGCANPIALSELREGEIVLDIGSGGGLDVILSARRVGSTGHVYGLDMTDEMLELAWRNALDAGVGNVTFLKGVIEAMPIPNESIDVVISNCVINLTTDKDQALAEVYRVLRPGGRLAMADVVINGSLPSSVTKALRRDPAAWGSCLAGALTDAEYRDKLDAIGFLNVGLQVVRTHHTEELFGPSLPAWTREFSRAELDAVMGQFTNTLIRARKRAMPSEGDAGHEGHAAARSLVDIRTSDAQRIQEAYEELANVGASAFCCSPAEVYGPEELASLPDEVLRLSSGCGTPVTDAVIERGATVIDIGSGAGADCFLAAQSVGSTGQVIGVDPSPTMRAVATRHRDELQLGWVNFVEGTAEHLPLPNASADVVISNCVLSLAIDPVVVWREIARVLRPGGRFVVCDVIGGVRPATLENRARCETGITWSEYRRALAGAKFTGVEALRARAVAFRDGHRTESVTLQGRAAMPAGHRAVQVFALSLHRTMAQRFVALCGHGGYQRGWQLALKAVDLADPRVQSVLRLVLAEDLPGWDSKTWPTLAVVGEGRLIAHWHTINGEEPPMECLVKQALDQILMSGSGV